MSVINGLIPPPGWTQKFFFISSQLNSQSEDTFTFAGRLDNHQYLQSKAALIFRGKRNEAHNEFGKNEREQCRETQGEKKGEDEKLGSFLWSSTAMTQLCTLAAFHSETCDNFGHGWRPFQNKRLQFTHLTNSSLHHTSSSSGSWSSLTSYPSLFSLCLSFHFSSLLSPLHLPRDLAWGRMSYVVY